MAYFIYSRKCKASKNHKITFLLPNREGKKNPESSVVSWDHTSGEWQSCKSSGCHHIVTLTLDPRQQCCPFPLDLHRSVESELLQILPHSGRVPRMFESSLQSVCNLLSNSKTFIIGFSEEKEPPIPCSPPWGHRSLMYHIAIYGDQHGLFKTGC